MWFAPWSGYGIRGTYINTSLASGTFILDHIVCDEFTAYGSSTTIIFHMFYILIFEVFQGGKHWIRCCLSQSTQGAVRHRPADIRQAIDTATPIVFLGDSGTGKTHLLIGAGLAACHTGRRVRYVTAAGLVNELVEAQDEHTLTRLVARYGRYDLLCIDELGYLHLDPRGAELLFQVITEREERASIAVATNAPFSEWANTFTDPRLCSAIIDRLTFNAHIIETGTDSYRLRTTRQRRTAGAKSNEQGGANPA